MRIVDLYNDHRVPFVTEGTKHTREGWVNIACPFCTGNPGYHLGYNIDENYYHCWRCGGKFPTQVLVKILNVSRTEAEKIIEDYGGSTIARPRTKETKARLKPFKYPSGELKLYHAHRQYLMGRDFDPDMLQKVWGVTGTGPVAFLDGVNYSRRILIPVEWGGKPASFQCRAISDKVEPKYMACPMEREVYHHQHILYGKPLYWSDRGICVEGVTDVWRLGPSSFGVFGIDFTRKQVQEIKNAFKEVVVLFDPDPQAKKQANKLVKQLKGYGIKAWRVDITSDPGEMSQKEADYLVKNLLK